MLASVREDKGWLYRITSSFIGETIELDKVFPQAGTLFGLPDYIIAYIFYKIGVIKVNSKGKVSTSPKYWGNFISSDILSSKEIEVTQRKIDGKGYYLLKVGNLKE